MVRTLPGWLFLLLLSGCASIPQDPVSAPAPDPLTIALERGDCVAAQEALSVLDAPVQEQATVGQLCLQRGNFPLAHRLLEEVLTQQPHHENRDYLAYLQVLATFGAWSTETRFNPEPRVERGRTLFQQIVSYLREYPLSPYGDNLVPRLVILRESIAEAELALARASFQAGDTGLARARAEYVVESYSRTQAAADAARWLEQWP